MSKLLFICSGESTKEVEYVVNSNIKVNEVYLHDILYEVDLDLVNRVKNLWVDAFGISEKQINISYDIYSLRENLGIHPKIDYLIGFNIQELYTYKPNITLQELRGEFYKQSKNKSIYWVCNYLSNCSFKFLIEDNDGKQEKDFIKFTQERKNVLEGMEDKVNSI